MRDKDNPLIKDTLVFGDNGSSTEANFDLKSISLLELNENQLRLAIPIDLWEKELSSNSRWKESGLFMFELETNELNEISLTYIERLISESNIDTNYPVNSGSSRSYLNNRAIYYLYGNKLHSKLVD